MEQQPLFYPETLPSEAYQEKYQHGKLDVSRMPCSIFYTDVDQLPNEQYALLRKNGLGGSDSSILLGVNPYTTISALIAEKCRTELTEEEKALTKRARNHKIATKAKNATPMDYKWATAFEALLGYLHLKCDFERLDEVAGAAIKYIEETMPVKNRGSKVQEFKRSLKNE
jgi:hypothetical protein